MNWNFEKNLILMRISKLMRRKFNKVTNKILKQSERGKGLKKFDNLEKLFNDLGI
jgi:hypothetical protein